MRMGPYEVLGEVGRGGMGVVYRARSADGRDVALKVVAGTDQDSAFEREVRLLGSFSQADGFVPLIDAGSDQGRRFVVMPFQEGGTLRARFRRGPLAVGEAVAMVSRLAEAMGRAHDRGVVHRDLKPENVLFDARGEPLVADLGLAKHFRRDVLGASKSGSVTATGLIAGTPGYMAPEQIEDATRAGPRADVFALGAILYEALTGKKPFEGDGMLAYTAALVKTTPVRPSRLRKDVPRWLDAVIARALETDEAARFAHAGELALVLRAGAPRRGRGRLVLVAMLLLTLPLAWAVLGRWSARARATELVERAEDKVKVHDWDEALALATKAIELDPSSARAWANRAVARGFKGDFDGELADSARAIELDAGLALAWAAHSAFSSKRRDPEGAIADASWAIALDPRVALAWANRGNARARKSDFDGAIADYTRAIALDPTLAFAWSGRAETRTRKADWEAAIADFTRAIELDPKLVFAWEGRATVRGREGDWQSSIADFTRAIELSPDLAHAWAERGAVRANNGDWSGAAGDLARAIDLDPKLSLAWVNLGSARCQLGDWDGAIADETRAIELEPTLGLAWWQRGVAREKKGDQAGAIADYERFLELSPDDPRAPDTRRALDEARGHVQDGKR